MKVKVVETDDWQIFYVNGIKKTEDHQLRWFEVLNALGIEYEVTHLTDEEFEVFLKIEDLLIVDSSDNTRQGEIAKE